MNPFATLLLVTTLAGPNLHAPPITKEQEKLIEKLGDDEWLVREDASAKLKEMDYKALNALHKALKSSDLEVRMRAKNLLNHFYGCCNSRGEMPPIHGLYQLESFKFASGRRFFVKDGLAMQYYSKAGGAAWDENMNNDSDTNWSLKDATRMMCRDLRNLGYTREEVIEVLDKMAKNVDGQGQGTNGFRRFREMQGMPEWDGFRVGIMPGMIGARDAQGHPWYDRNAWECRGSRRTSRLPAAADAAGQGLKRKTQAGRKRPAWVTWPHSFLHFAFRLLHLQATLVPSYALYQTAPGFLTPRCGHRY
jgi:hypothetical protein